MVLESIIRRKRQEVASRQSDMPLERWVRGLQPSDRSLAAALRRERCSFILECKRASPSRGVIRADYDPANLARQYAGVASAVSVLSDETYFQGHLEHVREVREAVPLPVLCKDIIVSAYQVYEARRFGADAVLLMLSVLDDPAFEACRQAAERLSLDILVEVHDEEEVARALALQAPLIGINNRDFKTMEVDISTTEKLAAKVPAGLTLISESGILDHRHVLRLRPWVDGFLVGSSLMEQDDVALAARELIYGRVKTCGLTSPEDAEAAWSAGANFGGLILAAASPRKVSMELALEIQKGAPLRWVGVFVNESPASLVEYAEELGLTAIQLHGEEDRALVESLRGRLPAGCAIWKAHRVQGMIPLAARTGADRLVLERYDTDRRGGTGQCLDWSLLKTYPEPGRVILAGGLNPQNAAEADQLGTWALDVNSGVEDTPGKKSRSKLMAFFAALRGGETPRLGEATERGRADR